MKILLVDGDVMLRDLYQETLSSEGHQVLTARHAQEAVSMLDEYGADLVITEMMLPGHNGLEIVHEMQSYEDWQQIPVLILSVRQQKEFGMDEASWRELGVVSYLYKPSTRLSNLVGVVASIDEHARI